MDSKLPQLDWDVLLERMEDCSWSPAAQAAGLWAINVLREELGPRWPRTWRKTESVPAELVACWYSLAAFLGTLDLALALRRIRDIPGARALRDTIRSTSRYDALMSPRLQMRIASLAFGESIDVGIEPMLPRAQAPAGLLLSQGEVSCTTELLAVIRDAKTLDADRWLDTVTHELSQIGRFHRVDFRGRAEEPLDEQCTDELLRELERRAISTYVGLELPEHEIGGVAITISRAAKEGGELSFDHRPILAPACSNDRYPNGQVQAVRTPKQRDRTSSCPQASGEVSAPAEKLRLASKS